MDYTSLRPAGGKRSSKRDRIVNVFLRQKRHLSADDLCDLVRAEDAGIGRATVYRTLHWMVDAGVARKVDFGEGRSRYEPSYRHPRHFHLVCNTCHQSSEFLSSDVEALIDDVAQARQFATEQTVIQVYGTCESCRSGVAATPLDGEDTERVFARDALRMAIATERSGLEFYSHAAETTTDPHGKDVFRRLADEEQHHLATLEQRYSELIAHYPGLEARPTFLFFKGVAHGIFADGTDRLKQGVNSLQALMIGIRCERDSHKFFKKYGDRFEESEGKQVFVEFADEEREHRDLLIREYRKLQERLGIGRPRRRRHAGDLTRQSAAS